MPRPVGAKVTRWTKPPQSDDRRLAPAATQEGGQEQADGEGGLGTGGGEEDPQGIATRRRGGVAGAAEDHRVVVPEEAVLVEVAEIGEAGGAVGIATALPVPMAFAGDQARQHEHGESRESQADDGGGQEEAAGGGHEHEAAEGGGRRSDFPRNASIPRLHRVSAAMAASPGDAMPTTPPSPGRQPAMRPLCSACAFRAITAPAMPVTMAPPSSSQPAIGIKSGSTSIGETT